MLFSAGMGTRMGALTKTRPKPLIEVAGQPLIDHALRIAKGVPCDPIVTNTHYLAEQIETHLSDTSVVCLRETPNLLDTGGGLKNALSRFKEKAVLTLNTDAVWGPTNPLSTLQRHWQPETMDALLLLVPPSQALGHIGGDFSLIDNQNLIRGGELIYTGAQIISLDYVNAVPEQIFSLNKVWDQIAKTGRLKGVLYPDHWCDVGRPENIAIAEEMLAKNV